MAGVDDFDTDLSLGEPQSNRLVPRGGLKWFKKQQATPHVLSTFLWSAVACDRFHFAAKQESPLFRTPAKPGDCL